MAEGGCWLVGGPQPHYEQVAKLFMAPEAPYPNLIYVARVDCANQGVLCKRFDVTQYPTMYFAPPPEMARASRAGPKTVGAIEPVEGGYAAASLLHWMAERLQQPFVLDAERKAEGAAGGGAAFLTRGHVKASLLDMEEATVVAFDFIFSSLRLSPPMRPALGKVLHLFTAHHPSPLCRQGSAALLASLPDLWPPSSSLSASLSAEAELDGEHVQALQKHRICGPNGARGFWKDCKGSRPGTRGYSCGLWELFHSLTTRLDADEGAVGLAAIHAFVEHFFGCGPCRMHFLSMAARLEMEEVQTGREAVLWLWRAHNEVNRRLAEEEAADEQRADPQFPKRQWPPPELCPSCRGDGSGQWDEEQVHRFLVNHFAQPLNEPLPANATVSETIHRISVATTVEEEGKEGSQPSTGYVFGVAIVLLVLLAIAIFSSRSCRRTQQRRRK